MAPRLTRRRHVEEEPGFLEPTSGGRGVLTALSIVQIGVGILLIWLAWQLWNPPGPRQLPLDRQVVEVCWVADTYPGVGIQAEVVCGETPPPGVETFAPDQAPVVEEHLNN